jgi:uncharacterized membrane protein YeaQ/YmgE (transglycosylase-associated protein family)
MLQFFIVNNFAPINRAEKGDVKILSIIAWIVLGLIAGFIASKIVNHSGSGIIIDIVIGIIGAFLGGFIFNAIGGTGLTGFDVWSVVVATLGAIALLVIVNLLRRGEGATNQ